MSRPEPARPITDLRTGYLALAAWLAGIGCTVDSTWRPAAWAALVVAVTIPLWWLGAVRRRWRTAIFTAVAAVLMAGVVAGGAIARQSQATGGWAGRLGEQQAVGSAVLRLRSDPRLLRTHHGDVVVVRATATAITGRGRTAHSRAAVVVFADRAWLTLPLGSTVSSAGRWGPSKEPGTAATFSAIGSPTIRSRPGPGLRLAEALRAAIRASVSGRPREQAALVPALVVGDDAGVDAELSADFKVTGLTHLLAVSGTNLTLLVGFGMILARWCGVRGRWLMLVAALGIGGFVALARAEPSVLRAAAMGSVGLWAMTAGHHRRRQAQRALGVAVVVLLVAQPWLAVNPGFALSVLATAGIVLVGPSWRAGLRRWMPDWLAAAIAVPVAALLACAPVVAAMSGQVSLVAVLANLLAAPAVGPATVLGLLAGLAGLVWAPAGVALGWAASWCVGWILAVAHWGAQVALPAVEWPVTPGGLVVLSLACLVVAGWGPHLLRHRWVAVGITAMLVLVPLVRLPTPHWPPRGWVLAACDVGQGDALVLNAGEGRGVLIDAGPDARAVKACLARLGVTELPLVVLTHFHADHVDGLAGVASGPPVGQIWVTGLAEPAQAAASVAETAGQVPLLVPELGASVSVGAVKLQVLSPRADLADPVAAAGVGAGSQVAEEGSGPNNASLVLLARVSGVRVLLTGDIEPPAQAALARLLPGLEVDVLKVPHHGSRHQDFGWLGSVGAAVALISVGADNDYGHPAPEVISALTDGGALVRRTDQDGDLVVVARDDGLAVLGRG